jgi:intracellular sulfur oxidation DsrE/DsrF family protein
MVGATPLHIVGTARVILAGVCRKHTTIQRPYSRCQHFQKNPMFKIFFVVATALLGLLLSTSMTVQAAQDPIKTVYHLSEGIPQATRALVNIRNHLEADPGVKIVVVAYGPGIDFLLPGATNSSGQLFASSISALANQGVEFRVCNNTLLARKIDPNTLPMEAQVVPSGVAEVARLQAREGFVYLRP